MPRPVSILLHSANAGGYRLAERWAVRSRHDDTTTHMLRVSLKPRLYREIEIKSVASLYVLAEVITSAFKFDFEHVFGFFSRLTGHVEQRPSPLNVRSLPALPEPHPRRPRAGSLPLE